MCQARQPYFPFLYSNTHPKRSDVAFGNQPWNSQTRLPLGKYCWLLLATEKYHLIYARSSKIAGLSPRKFRNFRHKALPLESGFVPYPPGSLDSTPKNGCARAFKTEWLWDPFKSAAIRTIDSEIEQFPVVSLNWRIIVIRIHLLFNISQIAFHSSVFKMYFYSTYSKQNVHPSETIPQLAAHPVSASYFYSEDLEIIWMIAWNSMLIWIMIIFKNAFFLSSKKASLKEQH